MPPRVVLRLLALVTLALALAGCRSPLVGLHDLVVRFAVAPDDLGASDLRDRVIERLAGADVAAEVDVTKAGEVAVRVDAELAPQMGRLLLWKGGVTLAVVDDGARSGLPPTGAASREAVAEALARATEPEGHQFVVERLEGGLARPHAIEWPPVAELDSERATADGPTVVVPTSLEAETAVATLRAARPTALVAVTRGRTVLAALPVSRLVDGHRLVIPLGTTITAYTEAADVARLLATRRLPAMREVSHQATGPDWPLAAANLLLPIAMSVAWLFFVRQFDRAQPEPAWLVVATFVLGAVAVVPAGLLEWAWDRLSPYANPTLLTFGRSPHAFPIALAGFVVTVGLSEEATKLLAAWSLAVHRREFDEPVDGIVYGAAAALGFAAAENIRYLALGRVDGTLVASRAFMSVPAHLFFGTLWGYALGRRLVQPEKRVWPLFLLATALHGLFDTCLSIDGAGVWALVVAFLVASLFVVQLRSALRYGPVSTPGLIGSKDRGARDLFPMGSGAGFAGFVVAFYVFSGAVFLLAIFGRDGRAGIAFGIPFGVASASALAALGWSARGIAASLPLDAVVDDVGVTFAGAAMAYGDVVRIEREPLLGSPGQEARLVLVGATRRLELGPARPDVLDALAGAVRKRMEARAPSGLLPR